MRKYLTKQYGFTLLELLATIAISGIFITIIFSFVSSTFSQNEKTLSHINLRQEANIIITDIRNKHQEGEQICKQQLFDYKTKNFKINIDSFAQNNECSNIEEDLEVKFTLADSENNEYTIDTIIEKKGSMNPPLPELSNSFYDFLKNNSIFVYGSGLGVFGSSSVTGSNNLGTIYINNEIKSDAIFSGNNEISTQNIYLYKKENDIIFKSSTKLGKQGSTKVVWIESNVFLDNGAAQINGDTVYIDGSVIFNDSAKLNAKKVIITGNVTFKNWSAEIKADEVFIAGTITYVRPANISGHLKEFKNLNSNDLPSSPIPTAPSLFDEHYYISKGYTSRTSGKLENGDRIFSKGNYIASEYHTNKNNVIIISTGDIDIKNFGGSALTGVLFAPYGQVSFAGGSFTGVVVAGKGFTTFQNPSITFSNISNFITDSEFIPFK